jgi:hypothetical protein
MSVRRLHFVSVCVLATLGLALLASRAGADEPQPRAWLYTIGVGNDFMASYGHSAICIAEGRSPDGRCYDEGIARGGAVDIIWDSIRGRPRFVAVSVDDALLLRTFEGQERSIWKQDLPLPAAQVAQLGAALDAAVTSAQPYWYHPYYDNCSTRLRDALDAVTGGRLRAGGDARSGSRFRVLSEGGFSGRMLELGALAIFLGAPTDRTPSAWEQMFLPVRLRDAVEARLGARAQLVYQRRGLTLPTSTAAGRVLLVLLGLLMAGALLWGTRRGGWRWRAALGLSFGLLGALGLAVELTALLSAYPELRRNWSLLVLLPTDVAVMFTPGWIEKYLRARLGGLAALALASAIGLVQPLLAVAAMAALPCGAAYVAVRRRRGA